MGVRRLHGPISPWHPHQLKCPRWSVRKVTEIQDMSTLSQVQPQNDAPVQGVKFGNRRLRDPCAYIHPGTRTAYLGTPF